MAQTNSARPEPDVLVIGAGAAGLMAACAAAEAGARVLILERNEKAGKKIYITGKGRCNLTNDADTAEFFDRVVTNPRFLYSAVYQFDSRAVQAFFEENGCPLKTERGQRVFPVSDHASDVTAALLRRCRKLGVEIRYETRVRALLTSEDGRVVGAKTDRGSFSAGAVIVCTGGVSYPSTGSTGDGYEMAKALGHTVTPTRPSLVPFETQERWPYELSGLALKNVELRLHSVTGEGPEAKLSKKPLYQGFGELLFTHFGISGPLVLSASAYWDPAKAPRAVAYINTKPAIPRDELIQRLTDLFRESPEKKASGILRALYPEKMASAVAASLGLGDMKGKQLSEKMIRYTAEQLQALPLHITGTRGYSEAVVTSGGVNVREVDPSTLASKRAEGLYLAGEVLDVDALTGGFNLQIAWSTGHLAGESAARYALAEEENI